jgi:hypothetical protein
MTRLRIVLGNSSLASYPHAGGLWTLFLQFLLGLRELGHDVFWLELLRSTGRAEEDRRLVDAFFGRMREWEVDDRCLLLLLPEGAEQALERGDVYGERRREAAEIVETSDLLWSFACAIRQPLLSRFRRRALVDGDPGLLQVSALDWDMGVRDHDVFLTVGANMGAADCEAPTLGVAWKRFLPVVYLPMFSVAPDPGPRAPFTSITQWNWGELWLGDRVLSIAKRDAYLRYLELPRAAARRFELAANIHPDDATGDRGLLEANGWALVDPHEVAATPALYLDYIARSRAELSCPKPIYRDLRTGWLSDRSACYLAAGRPVLAEDTGFTGVVPTGEGLLAFRDMREAVAGVEAIDADFPRHSRAARELAEAYFGAARGLEAMLAACG